MGTIQNGLYLVLAVAHVEMEFNLEPDVAIIHYLNLEEKIALHSVPITKHASATRDHAQFMETFLNGPSFRAAAKRAGQVLKLVIDIAPTQNLNMVGLIVLH